MYVIIYALISFFFSCILQSTNFIYIPDSPQVLSESGYLSDMSNWMVVIRPRGEDQRLGSGSLPRIFV